MADKPAQGALSGIPVRSILLAILVLAAASVMIGLGVWQLDRWRQRRAINAEIQSRLAQAPVDLSEPLAGDPAGLEYRPAVVSGSFDYSQEIVLRNRSYNGAPGVHVLTPLKIAGLDQAVLVDRGWVPLDRSSPEGRTAFQPAGPVEVRGIIRRSKPRPYSFLPADPTASPGAPRVDEWYWPDLERIQAQMPYPLLPVYIEQGPENPEQGLPIAGYSLDLSEGPHLGYALQWFSFAAILLIGSAALARKRAAGG